MKQAFLMSLAVALAASAALAAPSPTPRTAAAEFTLSAGNDEGAKQLVERIRSYTFLDGVARRADAGKLTCLKGEPNKAAWLASHLQAEVKETKDQGKVLRVRLVDCPARDALALVKSVAA